MSHTRYANFGAVSLCSSSLRSRSGYTIYHISIIIDSSSSVFVVYRSATVEAQDNRVGWNSLCHMALYLELGKGKSSTTNLICLGQPQLGYFHIGCYTIFVST